MKLIFLDLDGVLCTQKEWGNRGKYQSTFDTLNVKCVEAFNKIIEETGAKIVVSSTWRIGERREHLFEHLKGHGVKGEFIGITPRLTENGKFRGDEIQLFLDNFGKEKVENFIIIDDDSDMVHLLPKLIKTDTYKGMNEKDAEKAIALLKKGENNV